MRDADFGGASGYVAGGVGYFQGDNVDAPVAVAFSFRTLIRTWFSLAALLLICVQPAQQAIGFPQQSPPRSPRIAELARKVRNGDKRAVQLFWSKLRQEGAPLIESMQLRLSRRGKYENNFHPSPLIANRHLRDVLIAKGYTVKYQEFAGHHSPANWRGTFFDALLFFLDNQSAGP